MANSNGTAERVLRAYSPMLSNCGWSMDRYDQNSISQKGFAVFSNHSGERIVLHWRKSDRGFPKTTWNLGTRLGRTVSELKQALKS